MSEAGEPMRRMHAARFRRGLPRLAAVAAAAASLASAALGGDAARTGPELAIAALLQLSQTSLADVPGCRGSPADPTLAEDLAEYLSMMDEPDNRVLADCEVREARQLCTVELRHDGGEVVWLRRYAFELDTGTGRARPETLGCATVP